MVEHNPLLDRAQRVAQNISHEQRMQMTARLFEASGIDLDDLRTMASSIGREVDDLLLIGLTGSLTTTKKATPSLAIHINIEDESITIHGKTFYIDQQSAAVVQCLLEANGERRSQRDMKQSYPRHIVDERLDTTIRRKLRPHRSGIGRYIKSDTRGFWLDVAEFCE